MFSARLNLAAQSKILRCLNKFYESKILYNYLLIRPTLTLLYSCILLQKKFYIQGAPKMWSPISRHNF